MRWMPSRRRLLYVEDFPLCAGGVCGRFGVVAYSIGDSSVSYAPRVDRCVLVTRGMHMLT